MTVFDLARVRADTPGVNNVNHLNNAGAGLMPNPVLRAIHEHIDLEAAIGGYEAANQELSRTDAVYAQVARLIGATPDEIAITENATVAWDMAFYALKFRPGDRILTVRAEYAANYVAYLQVAKRTGAVVEVIPDDATGATDPDALERLIDSKVKLISITWVPTNGGLVNPAAAIGRIANRHGIPYLLDACQVVGQMPVNVMELGCDMLTATGRKFLRGPRGTGFLYVRKPLLNQLEPPMIDHFAAPWISANSYKLRDDARRFETWENSYALRLGLGAAIDYALDIGLEVIYARSLTLATRLREGLAGIPGVALHDLGRAPCAIVSFTLAGIDSDVVKGTLAKKGINVSTSRPSSTLLDALSRNLPSVVRASPHYYNSDEEIEALIESVKTIRDSA